MERTIYADGVIVDSPQLQNTETTKAFEILRDRLDNWESGIESGLVLTVNAVNQNRVDLSSGTGYDPIGDYVNVPTNQLNIPLADNTLGALNFVYLFYTETLAVPEPHETNGTAPFTQALGSFFLQVLTAAQFALLPLTDPTFASNSQDRALLVGRVLATGGNLSATSISQPPPWRTLNFANIPSGFQGVSIIAVSDNTPTGSSGLLIYSTSPTTLAWQAPGELGPGTPVSIPVSGNYTLTALGGSTIQVSVTFAALPASGATEQVVITGLYFQQVPRMSSTDRHHRSLLGTGIPSPTNPHGMSIDDISPGMAEEITFHQRLMHEAGIYRGSVPTCLQATIIEVVGADSLAINAPIGSDTYWVQGTRQVAIANTAVVFTDSLPGSTRELYEIWVDPNRNVLRNKRLTFPSVSQLPFAENSIVYLDPLIGPGAYPLTWISFGPGSGGGLQFNTGPTTLVPPTTTSGLFNVRAPNGTLVQFWISNLSSLPSVAGTYTDTITVVNPAIDNTQFIVICQVMWTGLTAKLGFTSSRGVVTPRLLDQRLFGTLTDFNIRDDALRDRFQNPIFEKTPDGIAFGALENGHVATSSGLTVTIDTIRTTYVKGKRFTKIPLAVSYTVPANSSTVVYVDVNGTIQQTPFANALFVTNTNLNDVVEQSANVLYGAALALVTTSSSSVVSIVDMRRNVMNGNTSIEAWSVGDTNQVSTCCEFFDLTAALIYAQAAGQTELKIRNASITRPVVFTGEAISLRGPSAVIFVQSTAFVGSTPIFQTSSGSTQQVRLENLLLVLNTTASSPFISLVQARAQSRVNLDNVEIQIAAASPAMGPIVQISELNAGNVYLNEIKLTTGPFGPVVDCEQNHTGLKIQNLDLTGSGVSGAGIVQMGSGVSVTGIEISNVTDSGTGRPIFSGIGTIINSTIANVVGDLLGTIASTLENVTFRNCAFADTSTANIVGSNFQVQLDRCVLNTNLLIATVIDFWVDDCVVAGAITLAGSCSNVWFSNVNSGQIGQSSSSDSLAQSSFSGCFLSSGFNFIGSSQNMFVNESFFASFTGGGVGLVIDDCVFSSLTVPVTANLTNFWLTNCNVNGSIVLNWTTGGRQNIWIQDNVVNLAGNVLQMFDGSGSNSLSRFYIDAHIEGNTFVCGSTSVSTPVNVNNCSKVWLCHNTFVSINLQGFLQPVIEIGLTAATMFNNIYIDDNHFDVTQSSDVAGFTNFFQSLVIFNTTTSFGVGVTTSLGGNSFRNNKVHVTDQSGHRVNCVLWNGTAQGLACDGNTLEYPTYTSASSVNWNVPVGFGAQSQAGGATNSNTLAAFPLALFFGVGTTPSGGTITANETNIEASTFDNNRLLRTNSGQSALQWICCAGIVDSIVDSNHALGNLGKPYFEFGSAAVHPLLRSNNT